mmetsp:Transcript_16907/g.42437  ORF Transcript_16907/g.42437 Transcript_16907/m.42437 type:complete len:713 (-) Transcript_16907:143-2281(-)
MSAQLSGDGNGQVQPPPATITPSAPSELVQKAITSAGASLSQLRAHIKTVGGEHGDAIVRALVVGGATTALAIIVYASSKLLRGRKKKIEAAKLGSTIDNLTIADSNVAAAGLRNRKGLVRDLLLDAPSYEDLEALSATDGGPALIVLDGNVYDITPASHLYTDGGPFEGLLGRDITLLIAKSKGGESNRILADRLSQRMRGSSREVILTEEERKTIEYWTQHIASRYNVVGKLKGYDVHHSKRPHPHSKGQKRSKHTDGRGSKGAPDPSKVEEDTNARETEGVKEKSTLQHGIVQNEKTQREEKEVPTSSVEVVELALNEDSAHDQSVPAREGGRSTRTSSSEFASGRESFDGGEEEDGWLDEGGGEGSEAAGMRRAGHSEQREGEEKGETGSGSASSSQLHSARESPVETESMKAVVEEGDEHQIVFADEMHADEEYEGEFERIAAYLSKHPLNKSAGGSIRPQLRAQLLWRYARAGCEYMWARVIARKNGGERMDEMERDECTRVIRTCADAAEKALLLQADCVNAVRWYVETVLVASELEQTAEWWMDKVRRDELGMGMLDRMLDKYSTDKFLWEVSARLILSTMQYGGGKKVAKWALSFLGKFKADENEHFKKGGEKGKRKNTKKGEEALFRIKKAMQLHGQDNTPASFFITLSMAEKALGDDKRSADAAAHASDVSHEYLNATVMSSGICKGRERVDRMRGKKKVF